MKRYFVLILSFAAIPAIWGMEENINEQLLKATEIGDLKQIEQLLDRGAKINLKSGYSGITPLIVAIRSGHVRAVELLLQRGADVEGADKFGRTPLMQISMIIGANFAPLFNCTRQQLFSMSLAMAKLLLKYNPDVNAVDADGRSALHAASSVGFSDLVELLLESGAKVDLSEKTWETPLLDAAYNGDPDTVDLLLWHNADPSALDVENTVSPLMWAANNGHKDACLLILTLISMQDADEIYKHFDKMLSIRRKGGPFPRDIKRLIITKLVESLVDDRMRKAIFLMNQTNKEGLTASQIAAKKNHLELAKLLDPKNKASLNEIRNIILYYVKQILFLRPEAANE